jgi:hypothetical protein
MADKVETGRMSREEAALELARYISTHEAKPIHFKGSGADRAYTLRLYWECLQTVIGIEPK